MVRNKDERRYEAFSLDLVTNKKDVQIQVLFEPSKDQEKKQKKLQDIKKA